MRASLFSPYWLVSQILGPLWLRANLKRRAQRGKEDSARLLEREGISSTPRPRGFVVWLHAASVGESLSLLPLIEALYQHYPEIKILFTTGTKASAEVLKSRLHPRVIHQFSPLDVPTWVENFLDHWQPDLAVWAESELWPNMVFELYERGVPLVLINGRMSDKTYKRWRLAKRWSRALLGSFDLCLAQSQEAAERLQDLGAQSVQVLGNLKLMAPPLRYDEAHLEALKCNVNSRPLWLAASTHEGEEQLVVNVHRKLKAEFPQLLTIIAPRHPSRVPAMVEEFMAQGVNVQLRSEGSPINSATDLFIVDTLGEMGEFFALNEIVFLGGSLVPIGGHNLIEPAQLGCAILHGPHMHKTRDLQELFAASDATLLVNNGEALALNVRELLKDKAIRESYRQRAAAVVGGNKSILTHALEALKPYLLKAKV